MAKNKEIRVKKNYDNTPENKASWKLCHNTQKPSRPEYLKLRFFFINQEQIRKFRNGRHVLIELNIAAIELLCCLH